jgi:hypothetical protein
MRRTALVAVVLVTIVLAPASSGAKKPPGGGGGSGGGGGVPSMTSTYVKNYANIVSGVESDVTPEQVQATADGGWIAGALTQAPNNGVGVSWLLKSSAVGAPQWQEEVGCFGTPPGAYSDEVSLQRTSDGGYVLAGGTIGCGSGADCPPLSGIQCGLIEKLDGAGNVVWAQVYDAGAAGSGFTRIEQTSDGGYVAVGTATDLNQNTGALIVKLDSLGAVQWQRELGPTGKSMAYFDSVEQTADGGYIAVGQLSDGTNSSSGLPLLSVLAAKFDASGNVTWQHAFNDVDATGTVTATENALSVLQTPDGGFAIAGSWNDTTGAGTCCQGPLLLKLTSSGTIQWQKAYAGMVDCFFNGYSDTCTAIGGVAYSLQQTADGGFVLAGDSNLELADETPLVPWLAKVDGGGALLWQEDIYQVNPSTGRPLSEYFASAALTPVGPVAIGWTENYSTLKGELFGVQTDANGAVGTCSQIHPVSLLAATNPGLVQLSPSLGTTASVASRSPSPVQTLATSGTATLSQC